MDSAQVGAYFLVGPTAAGKSAVAQWIAEHYHFDILSADSMLVYEGMDIGTAKPTVEERQRVRYYGLDLVTPEQQYSVWQYRRYALKVLRAAFEAGRKVIVTGGTGLYVKSLTHGLRESAGPCAEARMRWQRILEEEGVDGLLRELKVRSPALLEALPDKRNPRRVMRALEQAVVNPEPPPATWTSCAEETPLIGLLRSSTDHGAAIVARVEKMYCGGIVEEVQRLLALYPRWSRTARQAIGYAEVLRMFAREFTREEAMAHTIVRTRQLAKRQRTWFRHQLRVDWVTVEPGTDVKAMAEQVLAVWRRYGPTRVCF